MSIDPAAATAAHLAALSPEIREQAAAYTVGSHWLLLWGLVVTAIATVIIVRSRVLERVSARLAERGWFLRTWLVGIAFFLVSALITLPWGLYEEWGREVSYGRSNQPLGDFLMQDAMGIALSTVLGALFFVGVFALIRKAGRLWWLWSGGFTAVVASATLLLTPILIEPLFNEYTPLPQGEVRDAVEVLADEAGIPRDRIFVYDGSRQSNNFTANVSGVLGSARIAISDVALGEADLDEVRAVTGHEIGHYVSGHIWRAVGVISLLAMAFFFLADRLYPWFAARIGSAAGIGDPVGLPVLMLVLSILATLAQPVMNAVIRQGEREADNYSLTHVGLPDALASALVKTAEYRDPFPTPLQEALFYTHPSVSWRVRNAMEWKAANPVQALQNEIRGNVERGQRQEAIETGRREIPALARPPVE